MPMFAKNIARMIMSNWIFLNASGRKNVPFRGGRRGLIVATEMERRGSMLKAQIRILQPKEMVL